MNRLLSLVIGMVALLALAGCGENHSWRQKIILEVETPNGVVSGGNVTEMTVGWFGWLDRELGSSAVRTGTRGEASFVEVAPGRYLFALLKDGEAWRTAEVFREASDKKEIKPTTARLAHLLERRTITLSRYPMLVTFANVNDPTTVVQLDPANLAATFGSGYTLKSISIEITDEKVTQGNVAKLLPFLTQENPIFIDWHEYPYNHPLRSLTKQSFISETTD